MPMLARRGLLASLAGLPLAAPAIASDAVARPTRVVQRADADGQAFMREALAMRRRAIGDGDRAYGAVVVKAGAIVGYGPSRVVTNQDPTAHAEMEAIRDAARRLGTRDLSGCRMYSTSPPCRMCETAAYWARLDRLLVGAAVTDRGAPRYSNC